jgi:hypothetical protein
MNAERLVRDALRQLAVPPTLRTSEGRCYAERVAELAGAALEELEGAEDAVRLPVIRGGSVCAYALVDADLAELAGFTWYVNAVLGSIFRVERDPRRTVYLAREVLGLEVGERKRVVFANGDPLDCRRQNLRTITLGARRAVPKAKPPVASRAVPPQRCRFGRKCTEPAGHGRYGRFCASHAELLASMRPAA